jgi:intraflagellar transport protein 172
MTWPRDRHNDLVFGLADGKIRVGKNVLILGILKTNKSNVLYSHDSYTVALASSRDGATVISGHLDGSVYAYSMDNQSFKKIFTHHSIPYALGFG